MQISEFSRIPLQKRAVGLREAKCHDEFMRACSRRLDALMLVGMLHGDPVAAATLAIQGRVHRLAAALGRDVPCRCRWQSRSVARFTRSASGSLKSPRNVRFDAADAIVDGSCLHPATSTGALRRRSTWRPVSRASKQRFPNGGFNATVSYPQRRLLYIGNGDGHVPTASDVADSRTQMLVASKPKAKSNSTASFYHDWVARRLARCHALLPRTPTRRQQLVWKHQIADQIRCSPTVVEDRAFVAGCDGKLHIIDLSKGTDVADVDIEAPTGSTPAVHGDVVYFGTEGGTFFAIDWKRAAVVWRWEDKARTDPLRSSAALPTDAVIFGSRDKRRAGSWIQPTGKGRYGRSRRVGFDRLLARGGRRFRECSSAPSDGSRVYAPRSPLGQRKFGSTRRGARSTRQRRSLRSGCSSPATTGWYIASERTIWSSRSKGFSLNDFSD